MNPILIETSFLPVCDNHRVFYAEYGNPGGLAILNIHGGPGLQSQEKYAQLFDLNRYRVIIFDQRGCGKSACVDPYYRNTLQDILEDMERIRTHLTIDNWFVNGGSWGSTVALAYAQAYPASTRGVLVASTFLGIEANMTWLYGDDESVPGKFYPDLYRDYKQFLARYGVSCQDDLCLLADVMRNGTFTQQIEIAESVLRFERRIFIHGDDYQSRDQTDHEAVVRYKAIYLHYASQNFFLETNQIIKNARLLESIPVVLVHGRDDRVCPLEDVHRFSQSLPLSRLVTLPSNGHSFDATGRDMLIATYSDFLLENG